ncbi:exopolysaccharide transport family protein [Bradyrhizobium sp. CB3481]|uniref:exopolysaccharide transport family protein n=1 Tax=Bradyrhizobium sp. CB3481 TaxID=3039158 RepID=UPI0024B131AB|nr:exopolysaccharide transport family protein [Bradyrhizobium sp. CB3481]WFU17839.1 exopolysaccharide transport family protein [Bradyrhizobium sp. CB3481]
MLIYDQPIERTKPEGRPAAAAPAGFSVLELVQLLWQRKAAIASAALIAACTAVAVGKSLTPKYTASAQLYVDPRELQLVDRELTPRAQDISGLAMVVESQARVITSNNVLLQVIRDTNLEKDPEFGGSDGRGFLGSLLGLVGIELRPSAEQQKQIQMGALEALNRHINVKKTDRTFIVDIDVWSYEPAKAAMLANAISKAYLAESKQSQAAAARRATTDLSGRLKELQERLRNAENTLAVYKAQNNFVGTQDTLISDQQLSSSNQRLAAARALTLDAQAKYDQIEASRKAASDPSAIPEVLQSQTIANLRAQHAEARKRQAELQSELGPRHPALRQAEQQVQDLRRTINEEVGRFAQAAKNDLIRARDYEASLSKALEAQKRQSVQMSQASVRLRELERDVEASRDVYQSFLKRSRETEEQESLNTSNARIIGEATVPQRRTFPPAMSLLAMIGFVLGGLAAAGWIIAANQLAPGTGPLPQPKETPKEALKEFAAAVAKGGGEPRPQAAVSLIEKPMILELQETDVIRTLGGILATDETADVTRLGWPTLRAGFPQMAVLTAMREMRAALARRAGEQPLPVMAVIGADADQDRSIAALNIALAAARDGVKVLLIDADLKQRALSGKVSHLAKSEPSRFGWLGIGAKPPQAIPTANGISILPAANAGDAKAADAIRKAVAQARSEAGHDLVILDGPALPWGSADRKLLDIADGLVGILPTQLDINEHMEGIISALGGDERKIVGVVLSEVSATALGSQQDKQYA